MSALLFAATLAFAQGVADSVTITETPCYAMVQQGTEVVTTQVPDLHVLEMTARDGPFRPSVPPETAAILCRRSTIMPAPNDWKVVAAGYPLYIIENVIPPRGPRAGVLEISQGQIRYRLTRGELLTAEVEQLRDRLGQLRQSARR